MSEQPQPQFDVAQLKAMFDETPAIEVTREAVSPVVHEPAPAFTPTGPRVAVVLTCHEPYLPYLRLAVDAIEQQSRPADELVVVLDDCEAPPWLRARGKWHIVRHASGNPNFGRNLGIQATDSDWLVFADADDAMHRDYLAGLHEAIAKAGPQVGIINADIESATGTLPTPEATDYWGLRRKNYVSSAAGWRRTAIAEAGGWKLTDRYDDWTLALNVTRLGYQTRRNRTPIKVRVHAATKAHRSNGDLLVTHLWHRSFGIVTLLDGRRDCLAQWAGFMTDVAKFGPENTSLYVLNHAGAGAEPYNRMVRQTIDDMLRLFRRVSYWQTGEPYDAGRGDRGEHERSLFNQVLPLVGEDMILTVGADVCAQANLGAMRLEYNCEQPVGAVGAVVAAVPGRNNTIEAWEKCGHQLHADQLPPAGRREVGSVGAGLTLWNNGYVRPCLPLHGWDWTKNLCADIAAMGGRIDLACGVHGNRIVNK